MHDKMYIHYQNPFFRESMPFAAPFPSSRILDQGCLRASSCYSWRNNTLLLCVDGLFLASQAVLPPA